MTGSRRRFLESSSQALAGLGLLGPLAARAADRKAVAPSDRLRVGLVGCRGMGFSNLRSLLKVEGVECVALCDVDERELARRQEDVGKLQDEAPRLFRDHRKLLDEKDLDAVVVGTPDHWHCLMLVDALAAGKHVYVEKPLANSIAEANAMMSAARKSNRVVQVGQWQRSGPHYAQALQIVRSGEIGKVRLVKVWAYQGWMKPVPVLPDSAAPPEVDYERWLGPAPKRAFNPNRFHFNFRWFWDYAGGLMTDWGVHEIDIALWVMDAKAPKSVMASGGKVGYLDDASETPDTLQAVFEYDGFNMLWEHATGIDGGPYGKPEGIAFIGNNGTLVVNRGGWEVIPETYSDDGVRKYKLEAMPYQGHNNNILDLHTKNFVDAIRANAASSLKCGIDSGSVAAINASMGNIALKTGRKLFWDAKAQQFEKDALANELTHAAYRAGYQLPRP